MMAERCAALSADGLCQGPAWGSLAGREADGAGADRAAQAGAAV